MRGWSAALQAHFAGLVTTYTSCLKLTLRNHQPIVIDITQADPGVVTTLWDHGWATDQRIKLVDIEGMTEVNDLEFTITVTGARTFSIGVDTTLYGAFIESQNAERARTLRVLGFTDFHEPLTIDGLVYEDTTAISPSAAKTAADLSVPNMKLVGLFGDTITRADLLRLLYENADYEMFMVNYLNLAQGKIFYPGGFGNLGQVTVHDISFEAELRGKEHYLQQTILDLYQASCRAAHAGFGNKSHKNWKCKVRLQPPKWQALTDYEVRPARDAGLGSVVRPTAQTDPPRHFRSLTTATSGSSEPVWDLIIGNPTSDGPITWQTIYALTVDTDVSVLVDSAAKWLDTDRDEPDDYFTLGQIFWITGANIGMGFDVKRYRNFAYPIVAVDQAQRRFEIDEDKTADFAGGDRFEVTGSTGNDGFYTVVSNSYIVGTDRTRIVVAEAIPDATADGQIEVKSFELYRETPFPIVVSDQYRAIGGCQFTADECKRHDNIYNMRADLFVPGQDTLVDTPDT